MHARRVRSVLRSLGPEIALALVVVLVGVSVWQAWVIWGHLRDQAREASHIYGHITAALADPDPSATTQALFELVREIQSSGIPLVVTDSLGRPTAAANTAYDDDLTHPDLRELILALDRTNPPFEVTHDQRVHFGALPVTGRLTRLALVQVALFLLALSLGIWAYRNAVNRDRDRLWVAMARESAHQLGTPLMSAGAWVDLLADGKDPADVAEHLRADLERLHRVAQRFERIGRPARRDRVALGTVAERVAGYFEPRLPRHAHPVALAVDAPASGPVIDGDAVLIEWAIEALVRNAVDALSGRGGYIALTVADGGDHVRVQVADNGPGIPPDVRDSLFEPGVTTKQGGWGIGLALARRIVEDVHDGRLDIVPSEEGATFEMVLPAAAAPEEADA